MTDPLHDPTFHRIAPTLPVADVVKATDFYRDHLGFAVTGLWPDVPYAIVIRGGMEIHFKRKDPGTTPGQVYGFVADVDALIAELATRGTPILGPPEDTFYHRREICLNDLDGNLLGFSHALPRE